MSEVEMSTENAALRAEVERLREDRARCRKCRERDEQARASEQFRADVAAGREILRAALASGESREEQR